MPAMAVALMAATASGCVSNKGEVVIATPRSIDVIESRYANAIAQKVVLSTSAATAGENVLLVNMFGPMDSSLSNNKTLAYHALSNADIHREMRRALPGVPMTTSALFLRNSYGPFGYAFGRGASGDAWPSAPVSAMPAPSRCA
jgi:hypothetical protein